MQTGYPVMVVVVVVVVMVTTVDAATDPALLRRIDVVMILKSAAFIGSMFEIMK